MASVRLKRDRDGNPRSYEARVIIKGHPPVSTSFPIDKVTASRLDAAMKAAEKRARAWAEEAERKIRGGDQVSKKPEKTTIGEAIDEYLADEERLAKEDPKHKPMSKAKRYCLGNVRHHVGVLTIAGLTRERTQKFINAMLMLEIPAPANRAKIHPLYDGGKPRLYSQSTVRKYYFALKEALVWHARKHKYPIGDKFEDIKVPDAWADARIRRLEPGEEERLMEATKGMYKSPEGYRLLIGLTLETAMRAQEILGLLWSEIDTRPDHRFILLPKERTKGRKKRQVSLSSKALALLARLSDLRAPADVRVFHMLPNDTNLLDKGFRRICKRAEIADLKFHDLRHEATTRMFESTVLQTVEVMIVTGHSQVDTLSRYAHIRPLVLAEKLDGKTFKPPR